MQVVGVEESGITTSSSQTSATCHSHLGHSMYKEDNLRGGHVIMLGSGCEEAALAALREFPLGLQIGGKASICTHTHRPHTLPSEP